MAERIENFMSTTRPRPGGDWQLEMLMFATAAYLSENIFDNQGWVARVCVNVRTLPNLMRSGFHVAEENVQRRKGYFVLDPQGQNPFEGQPTHSPRYSLKSTGSPRWNAEVIVTASTVRELSQFQMPQSLSAENVGVAVGFDRSGQRIYGFSVVDPDENFNAVYDDMPLNGWWPWPRRALHSSKKVHGTGELFKKMRKGWNKLW